MDARERALVPAIYVFYVLIAVRTWMPATGAGMTSENWL
jgi:hypothetical protein